MVSTTISKKRLSSPTISSGPVRRTSDVEPAMSTNRAATVRSSPPRETPVASARRDRRPDVPAEQVAQPLPLGEPGRHRVDALLQQPDLAGVVDDDAHVVGAAPHPADRFPQVAQRLPDRAGGEQRGQPTGQHGHDDQEDDRPLPRAAGVARVEEQQGHAEHRHGAGQPPGEQQAGADAEGQRAGRRVGGQRDGGDRPRGTGDEQVRDTCGGHAAEQRGDAGAQARPARPGRRGPRRCR